MYYGWRWFRGEGAFTQSATLFRKIVRYLFSPFVTAMLAFFFVENLDVVQGLCSGIPWPFIRLCAEVAIVTVVFHVVQYLLVITAYGIEFGNFKSLLSESFLPGIIAEFVLTPVGVLFVWALDPNDLLPFLLLGATYLIIADVFHRLDQARKRTLETVGELERLIRAGERAFAVLGYPQVVRELALAISRETAGSGRAIAGIWDGDVDRFLVGVNDEENGYELDPEIPEFAGMLEYALSAGKPSVSQFGTGEDSRTLALVPFVVEDQVEGFIGVDNLTTDAAGRMFRGGDPVEHVVGHLRRLASIAGIAVHNAKLYRLATVDGLTGLYVRRFFDRRYAEEVSRARRGDKPLTVLIVDVDDFKRVNDTYGHPMGDEVLKALARCIRDNTRLSDVPCRYGGDEFVVLLPETGLAPGTQLAQRLKDQVDSLQLESETGHVKVSVSIGVAGHTPIPGERKPIEDLVAGADKALYKAKAQHEKGCLVVWDGVVDDPEDEEDDLLSD